ncbi:SdiA-regulated domain-containing protein [uncultured Pontibacter sp.]|uniref:SdiA-regulated domain-containing protein n=1 Tax=uncultured Pontibacter sp. TaxID=453356 RepID=UPI0026057BE1|nr:SdiA-regulated domain-containing protein [uncultured Pontibacter sp.]
MASCNTFWEEDQVPENIKVRFAEMYPSVKNVDWDLENTLYEADFKINGREREVLLDTTGALVQVSEEIDKADLPEAILARMAKEYGNYNVEEVHRVQRDKQRSYVVELQRRTKEVLITFDEAGNLLNLTDPEPAALKAEQATVLPVSMSDDRVNMLGKPVARWELPQELREISGIAVLPDEKLACVQDEQGTIFIYDTSKRSVERQIDFAGPGDYEGIVIMDDEAIVLRSDATLLRIKGFRKEKPQVTSHSLGLAPTQDTEGMALDAARNRLLIAGKGYDKKYGSKKTIFEFDLQSNKVNPEPVILIELPQKNLESKKKAKSIYDGLQPASLEIHPLTNELYVLDAENSRIMVLSEQGKIVKLTNLNPAELPKAEGLAFGTNGEMYIASEGKKKGKGVITKYSQGL